MRGGIFSISSVFMKILTIGYIALVLLSMFFALNAYGLIFLENRQEREVIVIGDAILSLDCIVEFSGGYPVKGLLSEEKITRSNPLSCFKYDKKIYIEIYDMNEVLLYAIGDSNIKNSISINLPAALKRATKIEPVTLKITLGV